MKAVVFHEIGDIRLDDVSEPKIENATDAIVRITASAICGTDLHMIRGTMGPMVPGTIMGHEAVGIVEQVGPGVRNLREGDRVVIPSTIACGYCSFCRQGEYAQCDNANPNGPRAGTCFFGGPKMTGPIHGLQAERARVPFANVGPVKLPDEVGDDDALMLSDIFPTGYFGADMADIRDGSTVAVFGCGPVGQFAILSALLMGAGRVFAVDRIESRLKVAQMQGAEIINFEKEDPVDLIMQLTGGMGVEKVIDAVGVDADRPAKGPAKEGGKQVQQFQQERGQVAPETHPKGGLWQPGSAPSQVIQWAIESLSKAGRLVMIGVYPPPVNFFPIGMAMNRNISIHMGNCNHRKYIPYLITLVSTGSVNPKRIISQAEPLESAIEAYEHFDQRERGWVKAELVPLGT